MATGIRKAGDFCWINMITPQPEQAREFFARVLDWTYFDMPGLGYGVQVGGRNIGGLFDFDGPDVPPGLVPLIGVMVKVESADATCEKVASLGGTARPAFDVLESGRMAVCHDPNGAQFDIWEPKSMPGTDVDSTLHGAPSWFETLTTDVGRASAFYSGLFGWTPEMMPMSGSGYTVFKNGGADVAGLLAITPEMGTPRPHWVTYFTVNDADEAAGEAVRLGATLCRRPHDIPNVGRFCGITSPQGITFCVIAYTR
jgi:predicted enzyme related to lactoylglutathione lyase